RRRSPIQGRTVTGGRPRWQGRRRGTNLSTVFVDNSVQNFPEMRMNAGFGLGRRGGFRLVGVIFPIKNNKLLLIYWRCGVPGLCGMACDIICARPASPVDRYLFGKPYDS